MLSLLGWLPVIGPIIDGIVSIFNKKQDTDLGKYQVDGQVNTQVIKSSTEITLAAMAQIPVRLARDLIMFPGSAWCGLYIWDKIMAFHYPKLVWKVAPLDGQMTILPMALLTFFFGVTALGIFKK